MKIERALYHFSPENRFVIAAKSIALPNMV